MEGVFASLDISTILIFLFVFLIGYHWLTTPRNLPPGPMGLPLVGSILSFVKAGPNVLDLLHKWHEQYGDVISVRLGNQRFVHVRSHRILQEAFVKQSEIFSARPSHLYTNRTVIEHTGKGILFSDGPTWKELRRVTLMTMRDFGMGKKSIEQRVQEEARVLMDILDKSQGQEICMKPLLSKFTSNTICGIIFGSRFEYDDPTFTKLLSLLNSAVANTAFFSLANFLKFARYIPSVKRKLQSFVDALVAVDKYVEDILKERKATFDPDNIRDFVDLYIKTSQESEDKHLYTASNMRRVILDLFVAGAETTATALDWLIIYMVACPEVQKRCQQEVDKVIGQGRLVSMSDRPKLPYIEAVITEILRCVPIAPLGVPHMAVRDAKIAGYDIPTNTIVLSNIREIHQDPAAWTDPDSFRPDRFLDKDGQFHPPKDNYVPFSLGPRVCLGEVLARMDLFILFSTLMQSYTFTMDQGREPDLKGKVGITLTAASQSVLATRR